MKEKKKQRLLKAGYEARIRARKEKEREREEKAAEERREEEERQADLDGWAKALKDQQEVHLSLTLSPINELHLTVVYRLTGPDVKDQRTSPSQGSAHRP